jgi:hypothetical protein
MIIWVYDNIEKRENIIWKKIFILKWIYIKFNVRFKIQWIYMLTYYNNALKFSSFILTFIYYNELIIVYL